MYMYLYLYIHVIPYNQDTGIRTPTYAPKLAVLRSSALDHMWTFSVEGLNSLH